MICLHVFILADSVFAPVGSSGPKSPAITKLPVVTDREYISVLLRELAEFMRAPNKEDELNGIAEKTEKIHAHGHPSELEIESNHGDIGQLQLHYILQDEIANSSMSTILNRNVSLLLEKINRQMLMVVMDPLLSKFYHFKPDHIDEEKNFSLYNNSIFRISIDFPSKWILQQYVIPGNIVTFYDPPSKINLTIFDRINRIPGFSFPSSSSFGVDNPLANGKPSISNISFGIFVHDLKDIFKGNQGISSTVYNFLQLRLLRIDPSMIVTNFEELGISGYDGYRVDYRTNYTLPSSPNLFNISSANLINYHFTKFWIIQDNTVYTLFFAYRPDLDMNTKNQLQIIVNSLEFIK